MAKTKIIKPVIIIGVGDANSVRVSPDYEEYLRLALEEAVPEACKVVKHKCMWVGKRKVKGVRNLLWYGVDCDGRLVEFDSANTCVLWINTTVSLGPRAKSSPPTLSTSFKGCARCGRDHTDVMFRRFIRSMAHVSYSHWGMCPVTNEPILMNYVTRPEKGKKA